MKKLFLLFILVGCQPKEFGFKPGECIQEPDSAEVWEVVSVEGNQVKGQLSGGFTGEVVDIDASKSWVLGTCAHDTE